LSSSGGLRQSIVWADTASKITSDILQDRLEDLTVFELREDGRRRYLHVSVRLLYKYVLSAITGTRSAASSSPIASVGHPLPLGRAMLLSKSVAYRPGAAGGTSCADPSSRFSTPESNLRASTLGGRGTGVTYRERLGAYIHPRDMRKFSSQFVVSHEPEIIVRRHCMLLNFDPVRAIILRDRLLVLVPEGGDEITKRLEKILRGGISDVIEASFQGRLDRTDGSSSAGDRTMELDSTLLGSGPSCVKGAPKKKSPFSLFPGRSKNETEVEDRTLKTMLSDTESDIDRSEGADDDDDDDDEWVEMKTRDWIDLPFELQCLDAILLCVCEILSEDTLDIQQAARKYIERVVSQRGSQQDPISVIRALKDAVREMSSRVKGFVKSLSRTLDEDEDMALMNLSRLLTNPERFIQPVPEEVLEEESDEPELILGRFPSLTPAADILKPDIFAILLVHAEANLQIGLSLVNALDLVDGQGMLRSPKN